MDALQLVPYDSEPIQPHERNRSFYFKRALAMPANIVLGCAAVTMTLATQQPWIAGVAAAATLLIAFIAGSCDAFKRATDRAVAKRERDDRRSARKLRAAEADMCHRAELEELSTHLEEIEHAEPTALEHHDLEGILDQYTERALAFRRMRKALDGVDRRRLQTRIREITACGTPATAELRDRHREILVRRLRHWDECAATVAVLRAELALIADYVRLLSERISMGSAPASHIAEIVQRLDDLEAADAELADLTAA